MSNIYERLNCITEEAGKIPKKGHNTFSNYDYVRAVDALGTIKRLLIKYNIHLTLSETECKRYRDGKNFHTEIKVTARFINVDDPKDYHETTYYSVSADTLDKDIFKAKTNGMKYLFTQEFKLVTDDFIDTEQNGKLPDEEPEPISPEQITEIEDMKKKCEIDEMDFVNRLQKKFKVAAVDRLDSDQAEELKVALKIMVKK